MNYIAKQAEGTVRLALVANWQRDTIRLLGCKQGAVKLAERHGVELPITEQVWAMLYEGKPPKQAVADLMERTLKPELWR